MARMEYAEYQQSGGRWAGDYSNRDSLIPGGVPLDPAGWTADPKTGKVNVPSGTLIGRTDAERDSGVAFGPYAAGDAEVYLTFNTALDVANVPAVAAYRHGRIVYPEYLPESSKTAEALAKIKELYTVNKGRE